MHRGSTLALFFALSTGLLLSLQVHAADGVSPPISRSVTVEQLSRKAMALERDGQKLKAAAIYEEIMRRDATKSMVLTHRLVRLYADIGDADKALKWAGLAVEKHPDPKAYLAGVHVLVGNYREAETILKKELAKAERLRRKILLNWQLADLCEKKGDAGRAGKVLNAALALAGGTPEEAAAARRIKAFRARQKARSAKLSEEESAHDTSGSR